MLIPKVSPGGITQHLQLLGGAALLTCIPLGCCFLSAGFDVCPTLLLIQPTIKQTFTFLCWAGFLLFCWNIQLGNKQVQMSEVNVGEVRMREGGLCWWGTKLRPDQHCVMKLNLETEQRCGSVLQNSTAGFRSSRHSLPPPAFCWFGWFCNCTQSAAQGDVALKNSKVPLEMLLLPCHCQLLCSVF